MKNQAFNPYLPSYEYVPDGEPRIFGDRLYVYGSHDAFNGNDFCINDYVCWSAPLNDLSDWKYEGVIYKKTQDPRNADGKMHMCAPDCVQGKDGRFYLYYQLHILQCTSVAVADNPIGPFEFYGYVQHKDGTPWGEKRGDSFIFDPGVLMDDDGRIYLYAGFSTVGLFKMVFKLRGNKVDESVCLELADDMMTVISVEQPIVPGPAKSKGTPYEGHAFFEASSIRKINGRYYYVYSSELSHELCYAISEYPNKGFKYGGTLVSIGDIGLNGNVKPLNYLGNTHGGMTEINNQWYIFYHRQTNKQKCARQGCAEKIYIDSNGLIAQAEITSCGLNPTPLSGVGKYEARIACNLNAKNGIIKSDDASRDKKDLYPYFTQTGMDRESDGNQYIANMKDGAWAGFKYFKFDGKVHSVSVKVKCTGNGLLRIGTDLNGGLVDINIHSSDEWITYENSIALPNAVMPLYFKYLGTGSMDFDSFEIM